MTLLTCCIWNEQKPARLVKRLSSILSLKQCGRPPLPYFLFILAWAKGWRTMNREIFYNKNTVKKVPKFLSCLSIVKEACQEIQSFLSISQNRDAFRKTRHPCSQNCCVRLTNFHEGKFLQPGKDHSSCHLWPRQDFFPLWVPENRKRSKLSWTQFYKRNKGLGEGVTEPEKGVTQLPWSRR